jgi:hypothetical protein
MQDSKKSQVWEKSHDLTLRIYYSTSRFPREEICGLKARSVELARQLQRTLPKAAEKTALIADD